MRQKLLVLMTAALATLAAAFLASPSAAEVVPGHLLTNEQPVTTIIAITNQDVAYTFTATAGMHVTFDVSASSWTRPNGSPGSAALRFYKPSGGSPMDCGITNARVCEFTPSTTGTWTAVVDPVGDATGATTFTYALDQPPKVITPQVPISTTISIRGQNASYTFTAAASQRVDFNISATTWTQPNGSPGTAALRFYKPTGGTPTDCTFSQPRVCTFVPATTGTWTAVLDPIGDPIGSITFTRTR